MKKEKRIFRIDVGKLDDKDVKKYIKEIKTSIEPGYVYSPYIPLNIETIVEEYTPNNKILKIKEWMRFQRYGQKTINNNFYRTISIGDNNIPEVNLTEEEADFNKISKELKKIGL